MCGVHVSTIYKELKHEEVTRRRSDLTEYTTYSAERSITLRNCKLAAKNMLNKQNDDVLIYIAN